MSALQAGTIAGGSGEFSTVYDAARNHASAIQKLGRDMRDTFDRIDGVMKSMSEHWQSAGSDEVINMYNKEIAAKYPGFCETIENETKTIMEETANYESGDQAASNIINQA